MVTDPDCLRELFDQPPGARLWDVVAESLARTGRAPASAVAVAAWLLAAYGSPDVRQIDGIGGADALTSKAAIISKSTRPE